MGPYDYEQSSSIRPGRSITSASDIGQGGLGKANWAQRDDRQKTEFDSSQGDYPRCSLLFKASRVSDIVRSTRLIPQKLHVFMMWHTHMFRLVPTMSIMLYGSMTWYSRSHN